VARLNQFGEEGRWRFIVQCPSCGAPPNTRCIRKSGLKSPLPHKGRELAALKALDSRTK